MTYLAVLLLWSAAGYRVYVLRRSKGAINAGYAAAAVGIAAAFSMRVTEEVIDSVTGPYMSDLIEHLLVVVAGVADQLFLLSLRTEKPPRRAARIRIGIGAAVATIMIVSFVMAPVHHEASGDLDEVYGHLGAITIYRLVFNAHLTWVLIDNVRLCRRYATVPGDVGRSVSLFLVGWSSALCLIYPGSRLIHIMIGLMGLNQPAAIEAIGSVAATVGLCGLAVGILASRVVPIVRGWLDVHAGTRRLGPLWSDLTTAFPLIALPTKGAFTPRTAELRYDRRFVEVAEGLARAHIPETDLPCAIDCCDPLKALAASLRSSREAWVQPAGMAASEALPAVKDPVEERRQLLVLADAYTAADAASTTPTASGART